MTIALTHDDLRLMNKATFDAFIESGQYALSYTKACEQFGRTRIDLLISNKLLKSSDDLLIGKKKFLISDIIAGFETFKRL